MINTRKGLLRYTVVRFGVESVTAVLQEEMYKILQELKATFHLDGVLVYVNNEAQHL